MFLKVLLISLCFLSLFRSNDSQLIAVTALIRHGAKLPLDFYPNDPYRNTSFPFANGDLSNKGIREMYDIGKWLKRTYNNFLSDEYHPDEIYIQTVNYDRRLSSAEAIAAGIYPPIGDEWSKKLNWQPIPVHTTPARQDIIVNMDACPKKNEVEEELLRKTTTYRYIMNRHKKLFDRLSEHAGENIDFASMYPLYDSLFTEIELDLKEPRWVDQNFAEMIPLVKQYIIMNSMYKIERQIQVGPLLQRIINQFERAIEGVDFGTPETIYRKFMAYIGTDYLLYDITYALGLQNIELSLYGALYLIELRKNNDDYYVNIFYRNSASRIAKAIPIKMKSFNFNLEFQNFKEAVQTYAVNSSEWVKLCKNFTNRTVNVVVDVPTT